MLKQGWGRISPRHQQGKQSTNSEVIWTQSCKESSVREHGTHALGYDGSGVVLVGEPESGKMLL